MSLGRKVLTFHPLCHPGVKLVTFAPLYKHGKSNLSWRCCEIVYCAPRGESSVFQTSVKFAARAEGEGGNHTSLKKLSTRGAHVIFHNTYTESSTSMPRLRSETLP